MNHRVARQFAFLLLTLASMAAFLASGCGVNVSASPPTITGDDGAVAQCTVLPCLSDEAWDPISCSCQVISQIPDAAPLCSNLRCAGNDVIEVINSACFCVPIGSTSPPSDATMPVATIDAAPDATFDDGDYFDVTSPPDVGDDVSPCANYPPNYCGNGYALNDSCQCVPCPNTCPAGQTPGASCNNCIACNNSCPAGLVAGPSCTCVPPGTPNLPPDAGGPNCTLEGSYTCAANSWCPLGTCPDGKTEYGCYCDATGKSTCALECPAPPPCQIPGEGTCPYGSVCVYGSCSSASDTQFACSCSQNGQAYCSTVSCDAGIYGPDAGPGSDGGVTCLLEGYVNCNAGSFCSVGTCPDGTQIGCTCNEDGTASCDLNCPTPKPCNIPGEGTCPYGMQCTFGTCGGSTTSQLSCYCYGTSVSCYTTPCGQVGADGH
jgi:hypothetical protein